jgi:membrane-bound metal-dependent hydrolase YbcI (DUF457 family)
LAEAGAPRELIMDPVSHALLGRAFNGLDSRRVLGPGAMAAFILGALAPDVDTVLIAWGWDVYLYWHERGTHALIASPVLAAAVAGLVRLLTRGSSFSRLFVAGWIGVVAGHLLFDLVSGSDMKLLEPFSSRVFSIPLLTMADLSAIIVLLTGTLISLQRRRMDDGGGEHSAEPSVIRQGGRRFAVIGGLAVLLAVKAVFLQRAWATYDGEVRAIAGAGLTVARPEAVNGSLVGWRFYDRQGDMGRVWDVNAWTRRPGLRFTRPLTVDPHAASSRYLPVVRRFLSFAELPFAWVERTGGERRVLWSDLRFCDARTCDLSFGALLNDRLEPTNQVIQIGGFTQVRGISK